MTDQPDDALVRRLEKAIATAAHYEGDRVFAQLEALLWLRDMLRLDEPLPPTRGWAASPDMLLEVARWIKHQRPHAIVEMGSGTSTILLAACLRNWGPGQLVSLEHEPEHAQRTRAEVERHGLTQIATVIDAPLGDVVIDGAPWRWYTFAPEVLPETIDMLFVDGPPGGTGPLARYPALPALRDRLSAAAAIFLDDGVRDDEREIALRWQREDPRFRGRELPSEKKAWLLYRPT